MPSLRLVFNPHWLLTSVQDVTLPAERNLICALYKRFGISGATTFMQICLHKMYSVSYTHLIKGCCEGLDVFHELLNVPLTFLGAVWSSPVYRASY